MTRKPQPRSAQPCTNSNCALLPSHRLDNPGCTTFVGITVFEAKGRRATTRTKEERGGGRRNASRVKKEPMKPFGWGLKQLCCFNYPDCTCRRQAPRDLLRKQHPTVVGKVYELAEVTPEMDLTWGRVHATAEALHKLKAAVAKLLYLGPRARGSCKGSDLWANYIKQERRVQRLVKS